MNRLPIMFLSLFVIVTCFVLAGSTVKIGKAAPDREIPWWWGEWNNGAYADHACRNGIVIWGTSSIENTPNVWISADLLPDNSQLLKDEERALYEDDETGTRFGQWTMTWPKEITPGSRVRISIVFNNDDYGNQFDMSIEDCYVPEQPEPEHDIYDFTCWFYPGDECEEFNQDPDGTGIFNKYEIPIEKDTCRVTELDIYGGEVISDIDVGLFLTSAPAAYTSVRLTSPQGTRVDLLDGQSPSLNRFRPSLSLGTRCGYYPNMPDFVLDDDSTFNPADGVSPYNLASFAPGPGKLSEFNGENPAGVWELEVCNHSAPVSEQETIIRNGGFEQGHTEWDVYSSHGYSIIWAPDDYPHLRPHSGDWVAYLGGNYDEVSELSQTINLPNSIVPHVPSLDFWYYLDSNGLCGAEYNQAKVLLDGSVISSLDLCNSTETDAWNKWPIEVSLADVDEPPELMFRVSTTKDYLSHFLLDDITVEFEREGSLLRCWSLDIASDPTAPTFFDAEVENTSANTAIIRWKTHKKADSKVKYGTSTGSYPFEEGKSDLVTNHAITLSNLNPGTTYYYVIESTNVLGVTTRSEERQFNNGSTQDTYTLSVTVNGQGTVQRNPDKPAYQSGETVILTAVPANGHQFVGWLGDASGSVNPIQVTMTSNKSITASFAPVQQPAGYRLYLPLVLR